MPILDINRLFDPLSRILITELPYSNLILDIGSGTCSITNLYPYLDTKYILTDISTSDDNNFNLAKQRLKNNKSCTFIETNADDLSMIPDKSVPLITMLNVIEHLTNDQIKKSLEHVYRTLEDSGTFVILTPARLGRKIAGKYKANLGHIEEYTYEELEKILNDNGFEIVKYRGILDINPDGNVSLKIHTDKQTPYCFWMECKKIKKGNNDD